MRSGVVFAGIVLAVMSAAVAFADTLTLEDGRQILGQYEGGNSRFVRFRTEQGVGEYDLRRIRSVRISGAAEEGSEWMPSFGPDQERLIRSWFADAGNLRGLPPGLAKRESLPPGLARQVRKNGTLPPGLQRRLQPLPIDLERRLPGLIEGWKRVILGPDVLLVDVEGTIVDLLRSVF